jgi:urease accessory protein
MSRFPLFGAIPTARDVYRTEALPERARRYGRDTLTLAWEARLKGRARRRSDAGVEFATVLPRGTQLVEGDCLLLDSARLVVRVVERPEPVFVVRPLTSREWALFGYHIGNSHQPIMILDDAIVCADVPGMEQVLTYHAIPFSRSHRCFTPVSAVADHRHQLSR